MQLRKRTLPATTLPRKGRTSAATRLRQKDMPQLDSALRSRAEEFATVASLLGDPTSRLSVLPKDMILYYTGERYLRPEPHRFEQNIPRDRFELSYRTLPELGGPASQQRYVSLIGVRNSTAYFCVYIPGERFGSFPGHCHIVKVSPGGGELSAVLIDCSVVPGFERIANMLQQPVIANGATPDDPIEFCVAWFCERLAVNGYARFTANGDFIGVVENPQVLHLRSNCYLAGTTHGLDKDHAGDVPVVVRVGHHGGSELTFAKCADTLAQLSRTTQRMRDGRESSQRITLPSGTWFFSASQRALGEIQSRYPESAEVDSTGALVMTCEASFDSTRDGSFLVFRHITDWVAVFESCTGDLVHLADLSPETTVYMDIAVAMLDKDHLCIVRWTEAGLSVVLTA